LAACGRAAVCGATTADKPAKPTDQKKITKNEICKDSKGWDFVRSKSTVLESASTTCGDDSSEKITAKEHEVRAEVDRHFSKMNL
jgi:hypothetical protein